MSRLERVRAAVLPRQEPGRPPLAPDATGFGHLRHLRRDPLGFFLACLRIPAPVVRLQLGADTGHLVTAPEPTAEVLVAGRELWSKRTRGFAALTPLLGQGLLTSEGELWRRQRRIMQPAFAHSRIAGFAEIMVQATADAVDRWPVDGATVIDAAAESMALTLRIAGATLFGADMHADTERIAVSVGDLMARAIRRMRRPPAVARLVSRIDRAEQREIADLKAIVDRIVDDRRLGRTTGDDLLQRLLEARDDFGRPMDPGQLRDEVMTLLLAGHETTANALSWTLALLSLHPEAERRAAAEVTSVLGDRPASPEDLSQMPFLLAAIRESLRLYPPAWTMGRLAEADTELAGFRVQRGELALLSPWVVHRNPEAWDNPEGFDPERFLGARAPSERSTAYFPFGAGPRQCIGKHFALVELHLVLATILQRVRLDLVPGHPLDPEPLVTLRPRHGVAMTVRRR